ncbi:MAG: oxidoreductase [Bacteroides sp. SM23_62_1]|nr:MAG: oxidoreductase [Bacteroides sp. SM23_62_1]
MKQDNNGFSRRKFLENAAALGAVGALGLNQLLTSCTKQKPTAELNLLPLLDQAPDGEPIKAGVIGCGGRGTGAAINFLDAGPNLQIVALSDIFKDRIDNCRKELSEKKGVNIPDENCFDGFEGYKKVIEADINYLIIATPPYFRPEHFKAAVEARKHVFMEKPLAVDPVGARSIMSTAKQADAAGLCVVTGTQRHHQRDYIETYKMVMNGVIGDIVAANAYWNQSKLWHRNRQPDWSDMEFMIRDWVNWCWLSGDHIVEQHIHNIDVINWFMGKFPVSAVGFGSRQRRVTGDQYDNFSVDFVYDGEVHMHSMCRQINDCTNNVSEYIRGTEGYTNCVNTIWNPDGTVKWQYEYPLDESGEPTNKVKVDPYVQEHIDLITAIRTGQQVNEAEFTAMSNLTAIMGRISAYTGLQVTWDEMMSSDLKLGPESLEMGDVDMEVVIPVPGSAPKEN